MMRILEQYIPVCDVNSRQLLEVVRVSGAASSPLASCISVLSSSARVSMPRTATAAEIEGKILIFYFL